MKIEPPQNMISADVIIPVTTANGSTYHWATIAMRTCQASTLGQVWIFDNNADGSPYAAILKEECALLGVHYQYVPGPFNCAKICNMGTDLTSGKYIAYGCSDVIYYPCWLENIIHQFEQDPSWFYLSNYSFDTRTLCSTYRRVMDTPAVKPCGHPGGGTIVFKRESGYRWDEQFPLWELDADLVYYMQHHALKGGVVQNARCDHLVQGVNGYIDINKHVDMKDMCGESRRRLVAKWNL